MTVIDKPLQTPEDLDLGSGQYSVCSVHHPAGQRRVAAAHSPWPGVCAARLVDFRVAIQASNMPTPLIAEQLDPDKPLACPTLAPPRRGLLGS